VAAALLTIGCQTRSGGSAGGAVGIAGAKAVIAAMIAAKQARAPWRCARLRPSPSGADAFDAGGRRWTVTGDRLRAEPAGDALRLGIVGDARGGDDPTLVALTYLRVPFEQARVDLVVTVGGMGASEAELLRVLRPLAGGPWPVVAIPGDREALPAHRAAIARLRSAGAPIVDGAAIRFIEAGGAVIATLPGLAHAQRLGAGPDGCQHSDADAEELLAALAGRAGQGSRRILVSPRAPRTGGDSDLAPGGIHAGDVGLAQVLAAHPVDVVVHAPLFPRAAGATSRLLCATSSCDTAGRASRGPIAIATGSIAAAARFDEAEARVAPGALVITINGRGVAWQAIPIAMPR